MSSEVDVSSEGLGDLSRALTKKRLDCVKLSEALNAPPRGLADLMAQSRAFTDKLMHLLQDGSELSDAIKQELTDESGFPGQVTRLATDDVYGNIEQVKEELRIAHGYQPYLVAPEAGLRQLFERVIGRLSNPVTDLVEGVHGIVNMAADRAMNEACQVPSFERSAPVVRFPHFKEHILPVALEGLEELKDDAMKMARNMVEMEKSFISCGFFRYLTYKRIHEQEDAQKRRKEESLRTAQKRGGGGQDDDEESDDGSVAPTEVSLPPTLPGDSIPNKYTSPDVAFGMYGYLEKSSTRSRNKLTQFESSLWQTRFFGVKDNEKTLEYYHSEDAFLKGVQPSVVIHLSECVVLDTDGQEYLPQSTLARSKDHLDAESSVSLLIFIQNKDPEKPIYKNSKDLILRAKDASEKYQWFSFLSSIIKDTRAGAKVATWSTRAIRKPSTPRSDTGVGSVQARNGDQQIFHEDYAVLSEGHGLGAAIFWDPICRDANNGLLPSPGVFIDGDADLSMEKALLQHTADMKTYTRLSCETLIMTVPKVIVHCLVDRSTEKLGPKIEEFILRLDTETRDLLLEEDVGIAAHRRRVTDMISEIGKAQEQLKDAERSMGETANARIDVSIIELAGLAARLKKHENGTQVFITKPKPPMSKRAVTPEKSDPSVAAQAQTSGPPYTGGHPTAPPTLGGRPSANRRANGSNQPQPRRPAPPPVPAAAAQNLSASQNGAAAPPASNQQQSNSKPQPQQQQKQPQGGNWYGFRPFSRS